MESKIAEGLSLKQHLFDGVLNEGNVTDTVDFSAAGRSQFLQQIESMIAELAAGKAEAELALDELQVRAEEQTLNTFIEEEQQPAEPVTDAPHTQLDSMEQVMNQGMQFLSGLLKMATGNDMGLGAQKVEVDKATGEVVMRFKLPGFGR